MTFVPEPTGAAPPDPSTSPRKKVLVVEDLADSRESLMMVLDLLGYEVTGAADGQQGLDLAGRWQPDVVLLDLGLPVMDGIRVAQELRKRPETARLRIIALTGWGSDADRARTTAAGFDGHLVKPVDLGVLQQWLPPPG